jgi:hypothetical protein
MSVQRLASIASFASLAIVLTACSAADRAVAPTEALSGVQEGEVVTAAGTLRLRCEVRTTGGARSKISVDGNNLSPLGGTWSARVSSGANSAAAPATRGIGDEVEFDFSSLPNDIAAGATPIARNFIIVNPSGPDVRASILDAAGNVVVSAAADCRTR